MAKDSKDHSWRTAENRNLKKPLKNIPNSPYITKCYFGGFQEKKNQDKKMLSSKNKLQHIQLSDTTGTSNGTGFYGQMKLNNELFGSKHSRWVW